MCSLGLVFATVRGRHPLAYGLQERGNRKTNEKPRISGKRLQPSMRMMWKESGNILLLCQHTQQQLPRCKVCQKLKDHDAQPPCSNAWKI